MKRLLLFLLLSAQVFAANHYVLSGGAGAKDGSNWSNAFDWSGTAVSVTTVRGDTYVVGGGTYSLSGGTFSGITFPSVAGTSTTTIRAATTALDSGVTGWNAAFDCATTPAKFTQSGAGANNITLILQLSHVTFDGTLTGAATTPNKTQRGLIFDAVGTTSDTYCVYNIFGDTATFVSFINVQFNGTNNQNVGGGGVLFNGTTSDLTVRRCYFNKGSQFWLKVRDCVNQTIEYNYFYNIGSGNAGKHSAGYIPDATMAINATCRFNVFENLLPSAGASTYIEPQNNGHTGSPSGLFVYGNVFWATDATEYSPLGEVALTGGDSWGQMLFYNNTIYGTHGTVDGVFGTTLATGWVGQNNVFQNCATNATFTFCTDVTNIKNTGGVSFTNTGTGNFHLTADTATTWTSLSSPYNTDPDGVTRTSSVGAYQYIAAPAAPTLASATINAAGTSLAVALSASCTTGAGGSGGMKITIAGVDYAGTYTSGSGTATYNFSLPSTIYQTASATVTYTQPGAGIASTSGSVDLASFSAQAVTNISTQAIPVPTSPSATKQNSSAIDVAWTKGDSQETFIVYRSLTNGSFVQVGTVGVNTQIFHDTNLAANTQYYYTVAGTGQGVTSAQTSSVNATTDPAPSAGAQSALSGNAKLAGTATLH